MTWEAVGAIGQMIGAAAVVISIVYLSIQIRANTRATKGSASYQAAHSWAETNEHLYALPDAALASLRNWLQDETRQSLSDVEQARLEIVWRSIYQKLEGQYFLYKYGLLDAELWEKRRAIGRGMIESAYARAWWENEIKYEALTEEFIREIESAKPPDRSDFADFHLTGTAASPDRRAD